MADSQRLDVLKRLTEHLKGIRKANGYNHDLGRNVFRGRAVFGEGDPLPLVSILEAPTSAPGTTAGENGQYRKEDWGLMLQGWVSDDVDNPTDPAYGLMDDVERHLARLTLVNGISGFEIYPDEFLLGRSIGGITVLPGVVRPPMENVSSKAFFYLPVRIQLLSGGG